MHGVSEMFLNFYRKKLKLRKYNNVVEASHWSRTLRKLAGTSVVEIKGTLGNRVESGFTKLGFICYVIWSSVYLYCAYQAQIQDQTIIRNLYKTKLDRYGDDFERITSFLYVVFTMTVTPFKLSGNSFMVQKTVDIDKFIEDTGDIMDYNKIARAAVKVCTSQIFVYLIRMGCICLCFGLNSNVVMPLEKVFQVMYSDTQAIMITSIFVYFMIILTDRLKWINKVLSNIRERNSWEYKVFVRGNIPTNMTKINDIRNAQICDKIRACAKVYSMLYNVCGLINKMFSFALLMTMFHYLNYIILYLFYFMEATATGLFHDVNKYVDFLVYSFWEIAVSLGIIFLIVHICENTMKEAKYTSYLVHEIINENFSSSINTEAIQFSIQLLHEVPIFTLLGLLNLNYALLQEGARSVFTYLVIMLQFVTDNNQNSLF